MSAILVRNVFQRRGLEVHIANLFALRRKHRDSSFFTPNGTIREYARDYLRTWIPVWESDVVRERANAEFDAMFKCTLGFVPKRQPENDPQRSGCFAKSSGSSRRIILAITLVITRTAGKPNAMS